MQYYDAEFITSASSKIGWPETELPEIVLAGRSNVGKSSLINSMVNRKQLAYVGNTPGKTRFLNFYNVDKRCIFVDVPGYGYASRSRHEVVDFGDMMEEYFSQRKNLKVLILIVDYRHKPTKDDVMMIEYARSFHLPIVICATKKDKCKRSEHVKLKKQICETLDIPNASCIDFSSETKEGVDVLWAKINEMIEG